MPTMNKHLRRVLKLMTPLGFREEERDLSGFRSRSALCKGLYVEVTGYHTPLRVDIHLEGGGASEVWLMDGSEHPVTLQSCREQNRILVEWDVLSRFLTGLAGRQEELPPFLGLRWADHLISAVLKQEKEKKWK